MPFYKDALETLVSLHQNPYILGFAGVVLFDWITGITKALFWKVADSQVGKKGIARHTLTLLAILFVWVVCNFLQSPAIAMMVTFMYGANYLLSILENFGVIGIYVPAFLEARVNEEKKRYEKLLEQALGSKKDKGENKDD